MIGVDPETKNRLIQAVGEALRAAAGTIKTFYEEMELGEVPECTPEWDGAESAAVLDFTIELSKKGYLAVPMSWPEVRDTEIEATEDPLIGFVRIHGLPGGTVDIGLFLKPEVSNCEAMGKDMFPDGVIRVYALVKGPGIDEAIEVGVDPNEDA